MKTPILFTAVRRSVAASFLWVMFQALPGLAQPSQYMTYQGYLTDGNGSPLGTTNTGPKAYNVVFRVWDVPTGGGASDEVHAEVQTVTVDNGYFSVLLGQGLKYLSEPFASPLSSIFQNTTDARYMEITVQGIGVGGGNITILPRLQLVSSPYSFLAANAQNVTGNGVVTSANIAPNTITSGNIAPGAITDANMASHTITAASIAANTITGGNIAGGTITSGNIAANTVTGGNIASGTISGGNIASGAITSGNIANGTITGGNIAGNTVAANNLSSSIGLWNTGSGANIYKSGGNVGVGTTSPGYPLEVDGSTTASIGAAAYYYLYNTTPEVEYVGPESQPITIRAQWFVEANGLISPSDRRIKNIIGQSDPAKDLAAIQRLKVTDYRMKDRVQAGDTVHKGFIAQEVQAVIPEAVNKTRDFIPDIYAPADHLSFDQAAQTLRVALAKAHGLKTGDKVRLITDEATLELDVLATPDEKTFVVGSFPKAPPRIFVFGKRVDDFLAVDYNRIFSAGIGAIQDVATRVEKLEARQAEFTDLEQKAARVATLEQEVAELKQTVAQLAQATKAARQTASEQQPHPLMAASLTR